MWQWIIYNSSGLQAVAASIAALIAAAGFIVLCIYASDTRKIAKSSTNQTKDSVIPFLSLDFTSDGVEPHAVRSWKIHNDGAGPAINVKLWPLDDKKAKSRFSLSKGDSRKILNQDHQNYDLFIDRLKRDEGIKVEYESLAGENFRSTFRMGDSEEVEMSFENLSRGST